MLGILPHASSGPAARHHPLHADQCGLRAPAGPSEQPPALKAAAPDRVHELDGEPRGIIREAGALILARTDCAVQCILIAPLRTYGPTHEMSAPGKSRPPCSNTRPNSPRASARALSARRWPRCLPGTR